MTDFAIGLGSAVLVAGVGYVLFKIWRKAPKP